MSRGVLDQEAYDAAVKATAHAKAHGLKIVGGSIYHRADGSRSFSWQYEPADKPRRGRKGISQPEAPREPITQPVNDTRAPIRRGGLPKPVQEEMKL